MKKTAYINGVILDGSKDMEPYRGALLVDGECISAVIAGDISARDLTGCTVVDLQGAYVIPGLINMHVHLAGNGKPQKGQRDNEALVKRIMGMGITRSVAYKLVCNYAKIELMSGVTTVRTVGGLSDFDTRCRSDIAAGKIIGPRIISSNEGISVPGGHMAGSVAIAASSDEDAVELVNRAHAQGVDFIKLMITGGVLDATEKGMPGQVKMQSSMVRAACDRAHELGLIVAAHVESSEGVRIALENGVDSIEHGALLDEASIALFRERGSFVTCTISPALPFALFNQSISRVTDVQLHNGKLVFDGIIQCAKTALANGIPVALGNDVGCPYVSQYDFWRELVYFQRYVGVSTKFALHTATQVNARLAGIGDETGSLEAGKCADFVVLDSNPLDNLQALRTPVMVCARGKLVKSPKVKRNAVVDRELDKFL